MTLNNLSADLQGARDYDTALRYLEESLAILRAIGNRAGEGTTLNNLSALCHARGDYTALRYLEESLAILRAIGDRAGECDPQQPLGALPCARDYDTALRYLEESLAILRAIGDRAGEGATLNNSRRFAMRAGITTRRCAIWRSHWPSAGPSATGRDYVQRCLTWGMFICRKTSINRRLPAGQQLTESLGNRYAEVLAALENLAKQLGGGGLEDWERLSQQMGSGE